jgi:hypothetical protein
MATRVYPVILEPLKSLNDSGLEAISSSGGVWYAIISESQVLVREKQMTDLGKKYIENYNQRLKKKETTVDFLCYDCDKIAHIITSGKGIFRVKKLGALYIKDFEKGMLQEIKKED